MPASDAVNIFLARFQPCLKTKISLHVSLVVLLNEGKMIEQETYSRLYEPRREKTGLRGFRPGPTQTGLYKLRKELEA